VDGDFDSERRGEEALRRALELSPRLPVAHKFYAQLEADMGRPQAALVRLLGEAHRHGNDPELFAGLVHACRYCGLLEQSIAAHAEARRLDPNVPTSLEQTILMTGDIERLLQVERPPLAGRLDVGIRAIGLGLAGRREEARRVIEASGEVSRLPAFGAWIGCLRAWLDRSPKGMLSGFASLGPLKIRDDPEAMFQEGWLLCDIGEIERGLQAMARAVDKGYAAAPTLAKSRQFDALRGRPDFEALRARAEAGREQALAAFHEAGGERLLGRSSP
jgi:eukaryotic-like serine/threonine-protein kinase